MTGVKTTHVPYKGAVALNDLLAGDQVQFMFATIPSVIQFVRAGRLRAIAVTSLTRSASIPDVPTVAESGFPEFEASSWFGLLGPRDLPREIVDKLNAEVVRILKVPEMRDKLIQQGADPVASTPDEFTAYIRAETAKWARVVRISGAKAE
jgi:tripartite-type tricarboxylate transporter receptor subunit TctC